jgi:hypothetical protein
MSTINRMMFQYYDPVAAQVYSLTLPINPIEVDFAESSNSNIIDTIDGEPIEQLPAFDSRPRTLTWNNLPNKDKYLAMLQFFRDMQAVESGGQMQRQDLGIIVGNVWEPIKVIDVSYSLGKGPPSANNSLKFNSLIVKYIVRQSE